jgi:hypothetical protein
MQCASAKGERAMKIMERHIGKVLPGKWAELEEIEKRYDAIEKPWGFPPKRRYRALYGRYARDVHITEREWEGMAAMEAALEGAVANPEWLALGQDLSSIVEGLQIEVYQVLE